MANPIREIPVTRIDGTPASLDDCEGKVLLIVNVASKCGLTHRNMRDWKHSTALIGIAASSCSASQPTILPARNLAPRPRFNEFCRSTNDVDFPMFSKIAVTGPDKHPLYKALIAARPEAEFKPDSALLKRLPQREAEPGGIHWNFEKFLLGRDGAVLARFAPDTKPEDNTVARAIEASLAA